MLLTNSGSSNAPLKGLVMLTSGPRLQATNSTRLFPPLRAWLPPVSPLTVEAIAVVTAVVTVHNKCQITRRCTGAGSRFGFSTAASNLKRN